MYNTKLLMYLTSPILSAIVIAILLLPSAIIRCVQRREFELSYLRNVLTIFIILIFILYPTILVKSFEVFLCVKIDDYSNIEVLLSNPDVQCWDSEHLDYVYYMALPSIFGWGICVPILFFILLYRNRTGIKQNIRQIIKDHNTTLNVIIGKKRKQRYILQRRETFMRQKTNVEIVLTFLYRGYTEECYYWEIYIFARKFILTLFSVITKVLDKTSKSALLVLFLVTFLEINLAVSPYYSIIVNRIEKMSIFLSFLTANVGIVLWTYNDWSVPLVGLILALNLLFMVSWVLAVLTYFYEKNTIVTRLIKLITGKSRKNINLNLINLFSASKLLS
jgi:hypothetical protein